MTDNDRFAPSLPSSTSSLLHSIAAAGTAVGVLDALDGVAFFWFTAGLNPIQVLQYIASGALGPAAYAGGLGTAALGAVFHFALAFLFTAVLALLTRGRVLRDFAVPAGLLWGGVVWALMNLLVLPASAVAPSPLTVTTVVHGLVGHALFVGLTATLILRRHLSAR